MSRFDAEFTIYDTDHGPAFFAKHVKPGSELAIWSVAYSVNVKGLGQEVDFGGVRTKTSIPAKNETGEKTIEFAGGFCSPSGGVALQQFVVHVEDDGEDNVGFVVYSGPIPVVAIAKEVKPIGDQSEVCVRIDNGTEKTALELAVFPFCDGTFWIEPGKQKEISLKIPSEKIISFRIVGNEEKQTGGTDQADIVFP